jgi:hypothetical protein
MKFKTILPENYLFKAATSARSKEIFTEASNESVQAHLSNKSLANKPKSDFTDQAISRKPLETLSRKSLSYDISQLKPEFNLKYSLGEAAEQLPVDINHQFNPEKPKLNFYQQLNKSYEKTLRNLVGVAETTNNMRNTSSGNLLFTVPVTDSSTPNFQFNLSKNLINKLEEKTASKGSELNWREIIQLSLEPNENTLTDWNEDWLNLWNEISYSDPSVFREHRGLATFFTHNEAMNRALARSIINKNTIEYPQDSPIKPSPKQLPKLSKKLASAWFKNLSMSDSYRIKELASSNRPNRYEAMKKELKNQAIEYIVTDFEGVDLSNLTQCNTKKFKLNSEALNLLQPLAKLPPEEKVDVMLATYAFDSIKQRQDHIYQKVNDKWFKEIYRLAVPDNHPNIKEVKKLSKDNKLNLMRPEDLNLLNLEIAYQAVDINKEPFGDLIADSVKGKNFKSVVFPGGLINTVKEAFEKQLKADGKFIIGDVAYQSDIYKMHDVYGKSGVHARFKIEDYSLAKKALQSLGFKVKLDGVKDYVDQQLESDWQEKYQDSFEQLKVVNDNTFILEVRK